MMQNLKSRRITAWVAMLATVFVMLFSGIYLAEHAEHNCTGNDCPICAVINQCSNNLKTIGTAAIIASASLFVFPLLQGSVLAVSKIVSCNSLFSQKVRMNN